MESRVRCAGQRHHHQAVPPARPGWEQGSGELLEPFTKPGGTSFGRTSTGGSPLEKDKTHDPTRPSGS